MPSKVATKEDLDREREKLLAWLLEGGKNWSADGNTWTAAVFIQAKRRQDKTGYTSHVAPILGDPDRGVEAYGMEPSQAEMVMVTVARAVDALLQFLPTEVRDGYLESRSPQPAGVIVLGDMGAAGALNGVLNAMKEEAAKRERERKSDKEKGT